MTFAKKHPYASPYYINMECRHFVKARLIYKLLILLPLPCRWQNVPCIERAAPEKRTDRAHVWVSIKAARFFCLE